MKIEVIEQIIQDLELEHRGATLYYALDPFDLVSFCFPVDPNDPTIRSLDDIADEQAALYEVALSREPAPLLLSEYVDEVDSIFSYYKHHTDEAFYRTSTIEKLISGVHANRTSLEYAVDRGLKDIEDPTHFNVVLAVVMGIYSLGIQRFQEVCQHITAPTESEVSKIVLDLNAQYQRTEQTEFFEHQMVSLVPHKELSALTDARAIDRLMFINSGLEEAFLNKRLTNRHIILYLSSARRSREWFALPGILPRFPIINGIRYSIYRRPEHVFNMLVNRGSGDLTPASIHDSIQKMKETLKLLQWDRANRLNRQFSAHIQLQCARCVQEGAAEQDCANCLNLNNCKAVLALGERYSKQRVRTIQNLGLMSVVERYHELRQAQAESSDERRFLEYFKHVAEDAVVRKRAMDRITEYHRLIRVQLDFRSFLSVPRDAERLNGVFHRRKVLYLFMVDLNPAVVLDDTYGDLLQALDASENVYTQSEALTLYDGAIRAFTLVDGAKERLSDLHELLRCVIYLDCPTDIGDKMAFDHAREMLDNYPKSKYLNDFWLILSLVAPRLLRFDVGEWYANEGLASFPDDPRLHHARALNAIRLLKSQPMHEKREEKLALAIQEETAAIALCNHQTFQRLRGVGWNNLAYYYCFNDWHDKFDESRVRLAREAINSLKDVIPKETWAQEDISFFHTEALVEFYEARAASRAGALDHALYKLECARREISFAITRLPKGSYQNLLAMIESERKALREIKAKVPAKR
jgi:hypothetical protein